MPCDLSKVTDVIQIILTIISILVAVWIPFKIKWEQEYSSLLDFYRSLDYAIAFQGVIQFFFNDCGRDMSRVKAEYKRRFIEEVENKSGNINKENCLHFQRRVLAQFFWQLNECAKSFSIGKCRVANDFTNAEAKLLKILIYMGQAIDGDPLLYKDISSDALSPKPAHLKGQNKSLGQLYQILKKSKRFMGGR